MWIKPFTIFGNYVTLVPLSVQHTQGLQQAVLDGCLHELWFTTVPHPSAIPEYVERRLARAKAGLEVPFTVFEAANEVVAGATNYLALDSETRRLEIGGTWLRAGVQRTKLNTEAKRLLLGHAFEDLDCVAVEFRTHILNQRSRAAIERLGAKLDGVLRNHRLAINGTLRDTCVYSITRGEWPAVKAHLDFILAR